MIGSDVFPAIFLGWDGGGKPAGENSFFSPLRKQMALSFSKSHIHVHYSASQFRPPVPHASNVALPPAENSSIHTFTQFLANAQYNSIYIAVSNICKAASNSPGRRGGGWLT